MANAAPAAADGTVQRLFNFIREELSLPPVPSVTDPAVGHIRSAPRTPHCTIPPRVQSVVISTKCFALLPCEMAAVSVGLRRALQGVMRGT